MDKTTLDPAYIDSLGLAPGVSAEVRDGRVVVSVDLTAEYNKACHAFHEACKAVEAAEDARDAARRECMRLEKELGIDG